MEKRSSKKICLRKKEKIDATTLCLSNIQQVPKEILLLIFLCLEPLFLLQSRWVCRRWRNIILELIDLEKYRKSNQIPILLSFKQVFIFLKSFEKMIKPKEPKEKKYDIPEIYGGCITVGLDSIVCVSKDRKKIFQIKRTDDLNNIEQSEILPELKNNDSYDFSTIDQEFQMIAITSMHQTSEIYTSKIIFVKSERNEKMKLYEFQWEEKIFESKIYISVASPNSNSDSLLLKITCKKNIVPSIGKNDSDKNEWYYWIEKKNFGKEKFMQLDEKNLLKTNACADEILKNNHLFCLEPKRLVKYGLKNNKISLLEIYNIPFELSLQFKSIPAYISHNLNLAISKIIVAFGKIWVVVFEKDTITCFCQETGISYKKSGIDFLDSDGSTNRNVTTWFIFEEKLFIWHFNHLLQWDEKEWKSNAFSANNIVNFPNDFSVFEWIRGVFLMEKSYFEEESQEESENALLNGEMRFGLTSVSRKQYALGDSINSSSGKIVSNIPKTCYNAFLTFTGICYYQKSSLVFLDYY